MGIGRRRESTLTSSGHAEKAIVTDGAGRVVERDFDARGLVLEEREDGVTSARFRYDGLGRPVWSRGPDGEVATYGYDDLDRLTSLATELGGSERFVYDEDGLLRQHVQASALAGAPAPLVLNYDYDARGLLTLLRDPEAGAFLFEADALGRPVRRTGPGGADWRARYTAKGFLEQIEIDLPGTVSDETIAYAGHDARGYPATITSGEGVTTLGYTDLGRLESAAYPDGSSESFSYDRAGNRKTRTAGGTAVTYVHDAADRLTEIRAGAPPGGAVLESFDHDGAGRRTSRVVTSPASTTTYGYDARGRLASVERTGSSPYEAQLAYGATGRRTRRTEGAATSRYGAPRLEERGGKSFRLLRAGAHGEVVAEVETTAGGARSHGLARDGSANVGSVVTQQPGGALGLEAAPRRWSAFGTLRAGGSILERGYASQAAEGASGLAYMAARHYDPATGRFLQPDPLGVLVDELYAYARNNPYIFWDPTGLKPRTIADRVFDGILAGIYDPASGPGDARYTEAYEAYAEYSSQGATLTTPQPPGPGALAAQVSEFGPLEGLRNYSAQWQAYEESIGLQGGGEIFGLVAGPGRALNLTHGAPIAADTLLGAAVRYLGTAYRELAPGVFRSADGLRQFRMTTSDLLGAHGRIGPHVNFEALNAEGRVIENLHVRLLDP
jgi:RHS repeat-associated protein